MAPKRKATSASNTPKKAKADHSPEQYKAFYISTIKLVGDLLDDTGSVKIADSFRKLVSKKMYPDYYDIIETPISLSEISRNVTRGNYVSPDCEDFLADFKLMLDNAATFNDVNSPIVDDATKIYNFVKEQCGQFLGSPVAQELSLAEQCEKLINDVIDHEFEGIGVISGPFIEDVDKNLYPDYFKIVKKPTSFNKILRDLETKIVKPEDDDETNLNRLNDSINLIFTNAQLYNDPESTIHQDSLMLAEYFESKFNELKASRPKKKPVVKKEKTATPVPRPRKKKVESEEEAEPEEEVEEEMEVDESELKKEEIALTPAPPVLESNVMGKTETLGPLNEVFIKDCSVSSSVASVKQMFNNSQEYNHYRSNNPPSRYQLMRESLFPSQPVDNLSTIFKYQFPANGYCTQGYTIVLPADASSTVNFDFNLHKYLQSLERHQLSVPSGEDFQCNLSVNETEVDSLLDIEDIDDGLKLHYEIKLSYGMNIVTFECKVSPNVSKIIKKSQTPKNEPEEIGGRHTRHQLQQYKRSWDVEKITFYVISNN
ncbi:hypothetical protein CLIB1444_04S05182 [[Candida] jaroonii]|uniref:Uncharacterized protein n=1 Tax=[Candida] jaroonii TaxID=467808 RepID=A0ACA9Y6L2_9ASCO|nr:hypothetical protein CLIB1444_04S05182 [[Candida] jaroonii]